MTKGNQPEDSASERGAVPPPWKRGETTAATGLTAGDVAKAAAAGPGQSSAPLGPPPRTNAPGGGSPSSTPTRAVPAQQPEEAPEPPTTAVPAAAPQPPAPAGPSRPQPEPPRPPQGGPQGPKPPGPKTPTATGATGPAAAAPVPPAAGPKKSAPAGPAVNEPARREPAGEAGKSDAVDRASVRRISAAATIGTPMRAAVQVRRVDPWSIFKVTGVLAVAGFLIWMIAIAVLYGVLSGMGIWDQINSSFGTLVSADGTSDSANLISSGQVFGFSALFGVFAAIVMTALATILAYVYNVCADVVGGFEITLADLD
ncbi:DUF3566 domain-containing protein [Gordonia alkaliphila]|uniref:DUF3566 domain-containing protein n=1 Tax=Gordonia alkaliphila TaxID=1053547 RepID=A0ABP8Z148_9ACTN